MSNDRFRVRAWDKKRNRMHGGSIDNLCLSLGGLLMWQFGFNAPELLSEEEAQDYILIQCTGLTDSEGTLIWEGDVVLVPDEYTVPVLDYGQGPAEPCPHLVAIEYRGGEFGFDIPKTDDGETGWYSWKAWDRDIGDASKLQVIGNIYENPELLGGSNG